MDWPFVRRSKLDEMRLRLIAEKARADEIASALHHAQVELRKHRLLLAGQWGTVQDIKAKVGG